MAPLLDMMNYKPGVNTVNRTQNQSFFSAEKDYKEGEELFISYGEKPNYDLLFDYGFVIEENPFDYAIASIPMPPSVLAGQPSSQSNK